MYVIIGYLALRTGQATDPAEVLRSLTSGGTETVLLVLLAIGLFSYGIWRLIETYLDLEGHGDDAKGKAVRVAHFLSGAVHVVLGLYAIYLAVGGTRGSGGGSDQTEQATGFALDLPGGQILIFLVAAAFLAAGFSQLAKAWRCDFMRQLSARARGTEWVRWMGRLGYAARGVIFVLIAIFFWNAASSQSGSQAGGMAQALRSLDGTALTLVAAGLLLFGLFGFVEAIYRRITNEDVAARLKRSASAPGIS